MVINRLTIFLIVLLIFTSFTHAQDNVPLTPITVENAAQIEPLAVWDDMTYPARNITFNDDLTGFLTYIYESKELSLWSIGSDHTLRQVHTTPAIVYAIKHQHVAYQISADDPILHVWDLSTGTELAPFENAAPSTPLAWNTDASRLAYVATEEIIEVWDILTRERLWGNGFDMGKAKSLAFLPVSDTFFIQVDYNTGISLHTRNIDDSFGGFFLQTPIQRFESILFSADESRILITESFYRSGENGFISLTDVWDDRSAYLGTFEGGDLGFLPNGLLYSETRIGGPSRETTLTLRDPNTLDIVKTFVYGGEVKTSAHNWRFSPDGTRLVTQTWNYAAEGGSASADHAYTLWDVESGDIISTQTPVDATGIILAFSPDSTVFATDSGQNITLWDAQTGEVLTTISGHTAQVTRLVFSADGTQLLSVADDDTFRVWGIPAK